MGRSKNVSSIKSDISIETRELNKILGMLFKVKS